MIFLNTYFLRLDDASDYMDVDKWQRMESLLDQYNIKPIFGIIPENHDESLVSKYEVNPAFWQSIHDWINKGWTPAMHGYEHRYVTEDGGINPVNKRSEFAGLPYEGQAEKIRKGYRILSEHDIRPDIFFAPSHTFDENTLKAIKAETPIRIISDTVAWDVYKDGEFWFIPQQSGRVRKIPFRTVTFCYHPNTMEDNDFDELALFLEGNRSKFAGISVETITKSTRSFGFIDRLLKWIYFAKRKK